MDTGKSIKFASSVVATVYVDKFKQTFIKSPVLTNDISILSKITKDKLSSEVYEDKTERIFF